MTTKGPEIVHHSPFEEDKKRYVRYCLHCPTLNNIIFQKSKPDKSFSQKAYPIKICLTCHPDYHGDDCFIDTNRTLQLRQNGQVIKTITDDTSIEAETCPVIEKMERSNFQMWNKFGWAIDLINKYQALDELDETVENPI